MNIFKGGKRVREGGRPPSPIRTMSKKHQSKLSTIADCCRGLFDCQCRRRTCTQKVLPAVIQIFIVIAVWTILKAQMMPDEAGMLAEAQAEAEKRYIRSAEQFERDHNCSMGDYMRGSVLHVDGMLSPAHVVSPDPNQKKPHFLSVDVLIRDVEEGTMVLYPVGTPVNFGSLNIFFPEDDVMNDMENGDGGDGNGTQVEFEHPDDVAAAGAMLDVDSIEGHIVPADQTAPGMELPGQMIPMGGPQLQLGPQGPLGQALYPGQQIPPQGYPNNLVGGYPPQQGYPAAPQGLYPNQGLPRLGALGGQQGAPLPLSLGDMGYSPYGQQRTPTGMAYPAQYHPGMAAAAAAQQGYVPHPAMQAFAPVQQPQNPMAGTIPGQDQGANPLGKPDEGLNQALVLTRKPDGRYSLRFKPGAGSEGGASQVQPAQGQGQGQQGVPGAIGPVSNDAAALAVGGNPATAAGEQVGGNPATAAGEQPKSSSENKVLSLSQQAGQATRFLFGNSRIGQALSGLARFTGQSSSSDQSQQGALSDQGNQAGQTALNVQTEQTGQTGQIGQLGQAGGTGQNTEASMAVSPEQTLPEQSASTGLAMTVFAGNASSNNASAGLVTNTSSVLPTTLGESPASIPSIGVEEIKPVESGISALDTTEVKVGDTPSLADGEQKIEPSAGEQKVEPSAGESVPETKPEEGSTTEKPTTEKPAEDTASSDTTSSGVDTGGDEIQPLGEGFEDRLKKYKMELLGKDSDEKGDDGSLTGNYKINNPEICKDDGADLDILFLIASKPQSMDVRNRIREGYVSSTVVDNVKMSHVFLIGLTNSPNFQKNIDSEKENFNDVAMGQYMDAPENGTFKALSAMRWAKQFCSKAKHVLYADEAMFVDTDKLVKGLIPTTDKEAGKKYMLCPYVASQPIPRQGPNAVKKPLFPSSTHFRPYCKSYAVLLSRPAYLGLIAASEQAPTFPAPDIYTFGVLPYLVGDLEVYDVGSKRAFHDFGKEVEACYQENKDRCPLVISKANKSRFDSLLNLMTSRMKEGHVGWEGENTVWDIKSFKKDLEQQ